MVICFYLNLFVNLFSPKGTASWLSWQRAGTCCLQLCGKRALLAALCSGLAASQGTGLLLSAWARPLLLRCKESWDDFSEHRSDKSSRGLFKEIGLLCISKAIYISADQNAARGRGNGRRHCAVLKDCESER